MSELRLPNFAINVQSELERTGKTITWLAKETGISQCVISYYLSGKTAPTLPKALLIANTLNVPLSQLVGEDLFHPKKIASIVRKHPEMEEELLKNCSSHLMLRELDKRLLDKKRTEK